MNRVSRAFLLKDFLLGLFNATLKIRASTFLTVGVLSAAFAVANVPGESPIPVGLTEEQAYWRKVQEQKVIEDLKATALENARRETIADAVPSIEAAGRALQQKVIISRDGPPAVVKPSMFAGKGQSIVLGVAGFLFLLLIKTVWARCHREAEIRELSGGYLSDGTEVAGFKMPELFDPAPPVPVVVPEWMKPKEEEVEMRDPRQAFFSSFPEYLAQMRDALQELGRTNDPAQKQKILADMGELIGAFKVEANIWQLRPIMQVSTVLVLLLQRLAEKTKEVTPSAVRTIAGALDLLADLAVPDLRADLLVMPPLKILAVDDEPLCQRALTFALEKAKLTPDLAKDGAAAVTLAKEHVYDVVFMDIQMPVVDGFTACQQIHETPRNAATPVIFVTVQSDFSTRAQSTVIGGTDFMAKPFLIFELTVKAITYAARKRMKSIAAGSRPGLSALLSSPAPSPRLSSAPVTAERDTKPAGESQEDPKEHLSPVQP